VEKEPSSSNDLAGAADPVFSQKHPSNLISPRHAPAHRMDARHDPPLSLPVRPVSRSRGCDPSIAKICNPSRSAAIQPGRKTRHALFAAIPAFHTAAMPPSPTRGCAEAAARTWNIANLGITKVSSQKIKMAPTDGEQTVGGFKSTPTRPPYGALNALNPRGSDRSKHTHLAGWGWRRYEKVLAKERRAR
jgi:hypothetical protein